MKLLPEICYTTYATHHATPVVEFWFRCNICHFKRNVFGLIFQMLQFLWHAPKAFCTHLMLLYFFGIFCVKEESCTRHCCCNVCFVVVFFFLIIKSSRHCTLVYVAVVFVFVVVVSLCCFCHLFLLLLLFLLSKPYRLWSTSEITVRNSFDLRRAACHFPHATRHCIYLQFVFIVAV